MNGTIWTVVGFAFVSTCIWLIVRIINRRERWAKWTLATVVVVPVLYVASFGPACWIVSRTDCGHAAFSEAYRPIACAVRKGPQFMWLNTWAYARWGMARGHNLFRNLSPTGQYSEYDGFLIAIDNDIDAE